AAAGCRAGSSGWRARPTRRSSDLRRSRLHSGTSSGRGWCPTGRRWGWPRRRTGPAAARVRESGSTESSAQAPTRDNRGVTEMSKELLMVVDAVANEKGVPESVILEAIEAALATAAEKRYPEQDVLTRVSVDPKDGTYETFRRWEVVADDEVMESPDRQIRLMDAIEEAEGVEVGDYIEEQIENAEFGRIAAQAA